MRPEDRPELILREMTEQYPDAWAFFESWRDRNRGNWPDWCYCPMTAAGEYVQLDWTRDKGRMPNANNISPVELLFRISSIQQLSCLAAWRMGMGVYRFDPALAAALLATPLDGRIPVELLYRLPEWCVYVTAPAGWGGDPAGFFAFLEHDPRNGRSELRLLFDMLDMPPVGLPLYMHHDTIESMVAEGLDTAREHGQKLGFPDVVLTPEEIRQDMHVADAINLLLYLCADEADFGGGRPARPQPVKTRRGMRLFPASGARIWELGKALGDQLRAAQTAERGQDEERNSPRPHLRRAHWHTYRVGPGRAETRVRWLHPILVGYSADESEEQE